MSPLSAESAQTILSVESHGRNVRSMSVTERRLRAQATCSGIPLWVNNPIQVDRRIHDPRDGTEEIRVLRIPEVSPKCGLAGLPYERRFLSSNEIVSIVERLRHGQSLSQWRSWCRRSPGRCHQCEGPVGTIRGADRAPRRAVLPSAAHYSCRFGFRLGRPPAPVVGMHQCYVPRASPNAGYERR
jgi:hypothetical protein